MAETIISYLNGFSFATITLLFIETKVKLKVPKLVCFKTATINEVHLKCLYDFDFHYLCIISTFKFFERTIYIYIHQKSINWTFCPIMLTWQFKSSNLYSFLWILHNDRDLITIDWNTITGKRSILPSASWHNCHSSSKKSKWLFSS